MRVLWVSHSSGDHGAERTILEAVAGLTARGIQLHLVLPSDRPMGSAWNSLGVPVERIDLRWWMTPGTWRAREAASWVRRAPAAIRALVKSIQRFDADLVISNSIVIPQGAIAAALTRTPHIWCVQEHVRPTGGPAFLFGASPSRALMRVLSDRMIVPSQAMATQVAGMFDPLRIDRIHLAVEHETPVDMSHGGPILMMGRVTEQKGQEMAIRAVALLHEQGLDVPLDIVGEVLGDYARGLVTLATALRVDHLVRFYGRTDRPSDWFGRCRAVLICSLESFGRVTVEAMKAGAPVIGADLGGTAELIEHERTGLKFPPGDVPALAKCISEIIADPARGRAMGEAAQRWACCTFTRDRFLDDIVQSFQHAMSFSRKKRGHATSAVLSR